VALDTNVVVRYLTRDDPVLAGKARAIMRAARAGETTLLLDPVALSEVVFVLSSVYRRSNAAISDALLSMLKHDWILVPDKPRYLHALRLFAATIPHFGDACICAASLESCEGKLYSFDRALSSVPGIHRSERPFK
jgi:predicted nucleic acid-binding protein